jgi:DnaJ like chaperone protein
MAWVDGQVGQTEQELILLWGQWLGVSVTVQEGWRTAYAPRRQGTPVSRAEGTYAAALRLLGVAADSDPTQIKRAYRRLLSQHHPDKLTGSGASAERIREATERTRDLHQAYAVVRQQRGFR